MPEQKTPVNLINEGDLNNYLTDLVYQGQEAPILFKDGHFKSVDYVAEHKDAIVRAIMLQYVKHRLRLYLTAQENAPFLEEVTKREDLPRWAINAIDEGRSIHRFHAQKMTEQLRRKITTIRDFLYASAQNYVEKTTKTAKATKQSPQIRLDYLKTNNEYATFEQTLEKANKWHRIMTEKAEKLATDKTLYEQSLKGTEFVIELPNGIAAYRLTTPEALDFESKYMGHCVGKGSYDEGVKNGTIQIYSIRDKNGAPHVTFEVRDNKIIQCKGKGNKVPIAKYRPAVQEFVKRNSLDIDGDQSNIGLIQQDGTYYDIYHLPKGFVVKGDLSFSGQEITELPDLSDVIVEGNFDCSGAKITSLKGAPKKVGGNFNCHSTAITTLEGAPSVKVYFDCSRTQITSLKGSPQELEGFFDCSCTPLTSLEGGPQIVKGYFTCSDTPITSLVGSQKIVGTDFNCSDTLITSLEGAPDKIGGKIYCSNTKIQDLESELQKWQNGFYRQPSILQILQSAQHLKFTQRLRHTIKSLFDHTS